MNVCQKSFFIDELKIICCFRKKKRRIENNAALTP